MTVNEANRILQERWMAMAEEERFIICGQLYEAEKAILERLAPKHFNKRELVEFVFFHMHGMTVEESIVNVPELLPI
jgi:hypothetical protein